MCQDAPCPINKTGRVMLDPHHSQFEHIPDGVLLPEEQVSNTRLEEITDYVPSSCTPS